MEKEVEISNLKKNPFRDFTTYPIDWQRVEALKEKIEKSHFWAGIEARPSSNGTYEIAFGHHRLKAARDLGIKKAEITVREIEDGEMLYMMLSENAPGWKPDTAAITGMVLAAKKELDAELLKAETWEDWQNMANEFMSHIFQNAKSFKNSQRTGAGAPIILKYLGKGWNQTTIQQALEILKDKEINRSVLEKTFPKLGHANAFRKVYESSGVSLDDQDQEKFIEKINHDLGNRKTVESIEKRAKKILKEIRVESEIEPTEDQDGKINRLVLLDTLKLLKPALAKKGDC